MKNIIASLLLIASISWAFVQNDSDHYYDAINVNDLIIACGYSTYEFIVLIDWVDDFGESYLINWPDDHYYGDSDDWGKIGASLMAAGAVSQSTNWSSTYVSVGFENGIVCGTTSNARWLFNNINYMNDSYLAEWVRFNFPFIYY